MGLNQFSVRLASGLFASGAYARHVDQMKRHYCDRMTQLHDAVLCCSDKVRVIKPLGGFYLWVQVPTDHVTVWKTAYKKGIHVIQVATSARIRRTRATERLPPPGLPFYAD